MIYKTLVAASVVLGFSALYPGVNAMADEGFLECVGNSASAGYPVPQPSPSESAGPAPVVSPSPANPSPVAANPPPGSSSPVATAPTTGATGITGTTTSPVSTSEPVASSQDVTASPAPAPSSASSTLYGVFIKPERHNQGLLSADIYLLTAQGGWIKQVGHADLDPPSDASDTTSGSQTVYQSDASSPFPFQLTISDGSSASQDGVQDDGQPQIQGQVSGNSGAPSASLVQATLFSGGNLSNLELNCHGGYPHGRGR